MTLKLSSGLHSHATHMDAHVRTHTGERERERWKEGGGGGRKGRRDPNFI